MESFWVCYFSGTRVISISSSQSKSSIYELSFLLLKIIDFILLIWCYFECSYFKGLRCNFSLSVRASLILLEKFLFNCIFWPWVGTTCSIFILLKLPTKLLFIPILFTVGPAIWLAVVLVALLSKEILFEWLCIRILSIGDFALKLFKINPGFD